MDDKQRLWYRFEKSGDPADYLRYCKERDRMDSSAGEDSAPSVDNSIDGIAQLPES